MLSTRGSKLRLVSQTASCAMLSSASILEAASCGRAPGAANLRCWPARISCGYRYYESLSRSPAMSFCSPRLLGGGPMMRRALMLGILRLDARGVDRRRPRRRDGWARGPAPPSGASSLELASALSPAPLSARPRTAAAAAGLLRGTTPLVYREAVGREGPAAVLARGHVRLERRVGHVVVLVRRHSFRRCCWRGGRRSLLGRR